MRTSTRSWESITNDLLILGFCIWPAMTGATCGFAAQVRTSLYEEALLKYRQKEYSSALLAARQAVEQDANSAANRHIYGLTLAALQQFPQAEENLQKAIVLKPTEASYHYDLGYVLYQQKKYDQAVPVLKRAVELDGENLMARFLLGRTYVSSHRSLFIGDFSNLALEQFKAIAKRNPRFPSLHLHLAQIYSNNGDKDKALQELTIELEYFPKNAQAHTELGELLLKLGEPKKALNHLIIAKAEAPSMSLVHYTLAKAYRENHQRSEAIEAARRCIELDPALPDPHYLLAQLYQETDQPDLARIEMELFQKIKMSQPQS